MSIWAISDPHFSFGVKDKPMDVFGPGWENHAQRFVDNWKNAVKENDVVLVSGDISWAMTLDEAKPDLEVFGSLPGEIVIIKGNHEYWWKSVSVVRSVLPKNMHALQNDSIKIGKTVICGTRGWISAEPGKELPDADKKIYDREVERLKLSLKHASNKMQDGDELICMMHFPPFNSKAEDGEFTRLMEEYGVKKVVYGHIHGKESRAIKEITKNGIKYYLSSCDQINMQPILID